MSLRDRVIWTALKWGVCGFACLAVAWWLARFFLLVR